jgi:hypothetical protein
VEKFGANPSPDGAHEIDPTGEFSADYFEDFSIGLDTLQAHGIDTSGMRPMGSAESQMRIFAKRTKTRRL